jgi:hypothetical protein
MLIASAIRTEDPGFESHSVRFLGLDILQCCCQNLICIVMVCIREKCLKYFLSEVINTVHMCQSPVRSILKSTFKNASFYLKLICMRMGSG